jgi:predicted CoA-binding protein
MLEDAETWAIVGLSGDPGRTAYGVAAALQRAGKRIVPIHPDAPTVLGQQGYATLADVPFPIDVVDVFRRSEAAGQFADEAVEIGAKGVWFQLGVIDEDAFERTWAAGVPMVMDTCPLIEWRKRAA